MEKYYEMAMMMVHDLGYEIKKVDEQRYVIMKREGPLMRLFTGREYYKVTEYCGGLKTYQDWCQFVKFVTGGAS